MIRFVGNNADGLPQKRSQSARACEPCRKRKKRCEHNGAAADGGAQIPMSPSVSNTATPQSFPPSILGSSRRTGSSTSTYNVRRHENVVTSAGATGEDPEDGAGDRFVGDLNPESIFLAATSPQTTHNSGDDVGIWIPRKALEGIRKQYGSVSGPHSPNPNPVFSDVLLPYMQRQCQQMLPPVTDYGSLKDIYIQEIHPIFPAINLDALDHVPSEGSPGAILLQQSICLAASSSPRALRNLRLQGGQSSEPTIIGSGAFANYLSSAIRSSIDLGFVRDRIIIVQALTVLALFTQFSHQPILSAEITARAISQAQTIGLHLEVSSTRHSEGFLTRLFCCVWALDKLNAAFQGRPTLLHEHDFSKNLENAVAGQEGCFRLLLRVISLLDGVIAMYRPSGSTSGPTLPSFEEMLHECDAVRVPSGLLASVELLYHAVTMLSYRSKSSEQSTSPLQIRETASAGSIVSIIGTEYQDQISHMPFAPYALTLSLRVFYRDLRFSSKSPFMQSRARKQLLNACKLLRDAFHENFPSAMKVADLAEQTVQEMDKVYSNIRQRYNGSRSTSETVDQINHHGPSNVVQLGGDNSQSQGDQNLTAFDSSAFEAFPDLDVFELFDSDFHLAEIDAALVDSMAPTFPQIAYQGSITQEIL